MTMGFAVGDQVWHLANGPQRHATVIALPEGSQMRLRWNDNERPFVATTANVRSVETVRWRDVEAGDTVEFEVQGDTIKVKAQGFGTNVTVLGWRTTEVESIWDLLSLKKRNPEMPGKVGARIHYRGATWVLLHGSMSNRRLSDYPKIWVKIDDTKFDWCELMDPDKEFFEVIDRG
jgi:hypothetical protein